MKAASWVVLLVSGAALAQAPAGGATAAGAAAATPPAAASAAPPSASTPAASPGAAETAGGASTAAPGAPEATAAASVAPAPDEAPRACDSWASKAMPEGALSVGYLEADLATGRRACPRTEVGLGGRFGAIIDTPNLYGNLGVNGLVFGSWALSRRLEVFATLEAVNYGFVQNAALKQTSLALGSMTAGVTYVEYQSSRFAGAASARLLLPTSFEIPGARVIGAELGHASTWRPKGWLEVHSYLGVDFTAAVSAAASYPRVGGVLVAGAQLSPWSWFSFVLDVTGRLGALSYLAPTAGLRFRVASLGIELGGTLPLLGNDRHDFIMGGRFTWRID